MKEIYSDFAEELICKQTKNDTYEYTISNYEHLCVHHIQILNDNNLLNKAMGNYISIEINHHSYEEVYDEVIKCLKLQIYKLLKIKAVRKVMIVGLGNYQISCDSLGFDVIHKINLNEHMLDCSLITPGVYGKTHIKTYDTIEALKNTYEPDFIIIIDALATSKLERLYQVIQINDVGIIPGSGVGNHQKALNEKSLNIPIFCIGVATVISIASILNEMIYDYNEIKNEEYIHTMVSFKSLDMNIKWMSNMIAKTLEQLLLEMA